MNNTSALKTDNTSTIGKSISWLFGIVFFAIGVVNTFWGNDTAFGILIILLSFLYFLPVNTILQKMLGFSFPRIGLVRILLGICIFLAAIGVGELFGKIELMKATF